MPFLTINGTDYEVNDRQLEIYTTAEERWHHNLTRLRNTKVKYLLIGEAPPWAENGDVNYFYYNFNSNQQICNSVYKAFYQHELIHDTETALTNLAGRGFLLIDSLPLTIKYTGNIRNSQFYKNLVCVSLSWWQNRLHNPNIQFHHEVKVALAFKVNGRRIIECLNGVLELPNVPTIPLTDANIAADGSGYTKSKKLRNIFGLT